MMVHSRHRLGQLLAAGVLALTSVSAALAQTRAPMLPPNSLFLGGIPDPTATAQPLQLSVADAIHRALDHNLGALEAEAGVEHAQGTHWIALSSLLPNVGATISEARRKSNLEAFGFPLEGTGFPTIVGPFNVFDARVAVSQSVFNLAALNDARAEGHNVAAARYASRSARDLVVLVTANLYLQTLAAAARAETARAQLETAQALYTQAQDLRQSGIVPGLDVVRAGVQLSTNRQRRTAAENDFEKSKLQLARVVGLPIGQQYALSDQLPAVPVPEMTLEDALARAYQNRPDYLAAQQRVKAAEAKRASIIAEHLPSAQVTADYGTIGLTPGTALPTFDVMGALQIPIFQGGRTRGRLLETDSDLRRRKAELEDMRASIDYDVRSALLDLKATSEQLQAATEARDLAAQQLAQSRDRFAAGVANNVEVVQAQEAVALASEQYISALYGYNVSKALLAESLGTAEEAVQRYLGGSH